MMNSSQQSENDGQEESPPPALQHDTQASLRRRISRTESHRIFVTPSTLPATARSRRTRSNLNHDINSPIVMDLPLEEEVVHPTTNSNRTFPTRRSNRIANNRAPGTDLDDSSIQHTTPSSSIRTRRVRNSTSRRTSFQQHTEHVAEESQQYITPPSIRDTALNNTRMTTGERSSNQRLEPAYVFNRTRRICMCDQICGNGIIIECG